MMQKNVAIILAAGQGDRSGFERPKQMMKLAGRPLVEHTIELFQRSAYIDEIIVVTNRDCMEGVQQIVVNARFSRVKHIILGGSERYESSVAAIAAVEPLAASYDVKLIFHDAVRPLLDERTIGDVVRALRHYNAVDVVVPTTDTIIVADPITNTVAGVPDRARLRNGQTPQGFSFETIKMAYQRALADPSFKTTDDCGVVLKYLPEEKIYLVNGERDNVKLTYAEDLQVIDKLLQLKSRSSADAVQDTQALAAFRDKTMVVFGGTSGIGADIVRLARAHQAHVIAASRSTGVDVTTISAVRDCVEQSCADYGRIDYVVNSAAVLNRQPLADMDYADIVQAVNINYLGVINVALASFEALQASKGQLLNFTSSSYTYGRAFYSVYSSTKAAVVNLTQALAEEWHAAGVRVNCINPQRTRTPMRTRAFGIEPPETLIDSVDVARQSLAVLLGHATGQVFDVQNRATTDPRKVR